MVESWTPLDHIKPRRRSMGFCVTPDEADMLFRRWAEKFPSLRYFSMAKYRALPSDPAPPETVISTSPWNLPNKYVVDGLLVGDKWRPKWKRFKFGDGGNWRMVNVPRPHFSISVPQVRQIDCRYLREHLQMLDIQVIWNFGNPAGPPMASYLFSTIRKTQTRNKAICVTFDGEPNFWQPISRIDCSPAALAWAAEKPLRLANTLGSQGYLPADADLGKLGFGDLPRMTMKLLRARDKRWRELLAQGRILEF